MHGNKRVLFSCIIGPVQQSTADCCLLLHVVFKYFSYSLPLHCESEIGRELGCVV